MTVDYQEKAYAAGRIPGGSLKREGRPSDKETLTSRLIDRPLRPLFPDDFYNEVQVIATVMSLNPEIDSDIPALIGASAAMSISGVPFNGPIGAARVGYINGQYVLCPTLSQLKESQLDLVVAGTESAVLMVESEAQELSEEVMLGAVVFGHTEMQKAINAINELVEEAGKPDGTRQPPAKDEALVARLSELVSAELERLYNITVKQTRSQAVKVIRAEAVAALCQGEGAPDENTVGNLFHGIEAGIVRGRILSGAPRIDGRDTRTVRPITMRSGVLPRTHGSRRSRAAKHRLWPLPPSGPTATSRSSMRWPVNTAIASCCTTTCRRTRLANAVVSVRRSVARSVTDVLPSVDRWLFCQSRKISPTRFVWFPKLPSPTAPRRWLPSVAAVWAMLDAGVPLKAHVAGIAMGLIKEGNRFAVLPTSSATKITSATWTSRWPARQLVSRPCRWTSRFRASPRRSCRLHWRKPRRRACTFSS